MPTRDTRQPVAAVRATENVDFVRKCACRASGLESKPGFCEGPGAERQ